MFACRFRRTALFALTLSAGLLAASEASAAQTSRIDRTVTAARLEIVAVSPWAKAVMGFFSGFRSKNGGYNHPPGPPNKPGNSSAKPEGPGLCPSGVMAGGN